MKISKARLVEIIKEEIENLEEGPFGGLFGRGKKPPSSQRDFEKGSYEQTPEQARGELQARAGEIKTGDTTAGLNKNQLKAYRAAIADASEMDQETFSKVMDWANRKKVVTQGDIENYSSKKDAQQDQAIQSLSSRFDTLDDPEEIGDSLLSDEEFVNQMRAKVARGKLFKTTFGKAISPMIKKQISSMQNKGFEPSDDFVDKVVNKILHRQVEKGEKLKKDQDERLEKLGVDLGSQIGEQ